MTFCWLLGHGHRIRTRNDQGQLVLRCEDCAHDQPVLQQEAITGPAHQVPRDLGAVKTKAIRVATKPTEVVRPFAGRK